LRQCHQIKFSQISEKIIPPFTYAGCWILVFPALLPTLLPLTIVGVTDRKSINPPSPSLSIRAPEMLLDRTEGTALILGNIQDRFV
jgi:hypothetical protein